MIRSVLIHILRAKVIHSPYLEPYKSDRFDELLPIYQKLELEPWYGEKIPEERSRVFLGNMDTFRDRTGTISHYLKMVPYEPLPEYDQSFNKSFKQICFERAEELVKTGQRLNVAWSGGLDSSTLLLTLLEIADPKQIKVFCNWSSIVESGSLFDKHIRSRGVEYDISASMYEPKYDDGLIVCGYPCDQLFGRFYTIQPEDFTRNWKDWILPEQVQLLEEMISKFPGPPIVTVPEYLSFIELNCKWEKTKYSKSRTLEKYVADRIINFYETIDFQKWSIGRYEPKYNGTEPTGNKYPLKLILKELMKSDGFAMNKIVQTSHYNIIDPSWVMQLQDGKNLYWDDF